MSIPNDKTNIKQIQINLLFSTKKTANAFWKTENTSSSSGHNLE